MCAYHSVEWLDNEPIDSDEDSDEEDIDCVLCTSQPALCEDCAIPNVTTQNGTAQDTKEEDDEEDKETDEK